MAVKILVSIAVALLWSKSCLVNGHEIKVINQCKQTLWIGTFGDNEIPANGGFKLDSRGQRSFKVRDEWTSGRVWAKTGCDRNGRNCATGESPPGGRTTLQAVTLAEFGLDKYMGQDFYDISLVDGFNVPVAIRPYGVAAGSKCKRIGCKFDFNKCPQNFKEVRSGNTIACKSACSATREPRYCCPWPNYNANNCHPSDYSRIFKNQCPDAFSYAHDEESSTFVCTGQSKSSSSYEVIFCP